MKMFVGRDFDPSPRLAKFRAKGASTSMEYQMDQKFLSSLHLRLGLEGGQVLLSNQEKKKYFSTMFINLFFLVPSFLQFFPEDNQ